MSAVPDITTEPSTGAVPDLTIDLLVTLAIEAARRALVSGGLSLTPELRSVLELSAREQMWQAIVVHRRAIEQTEEAGRARTERAVDGFVTKLEAAKGDASVLRIALADSQALLASRADRWAVEKAQLVDVVLAMGDVIRILRHAPGRGEAAP